ncbi:MAG TPA: GGDEF domain-containing protein [Xanthobacteraceae bacterium]|nr:GGDEF domain-containing protein [Xanthobacteraceae bacterium]
MRKRDGLPAAKAAHRKAARASEAEPTARRAPERAPEREPRLRLRSDPLRLAAEVAELQAELDALRARIRELEAHADVDPLTDVLNRRGFERELRRAIAYVRRYKAHAVLVYLDLDGFKPINDRHGHAAGDAMLQALAAEIVRRARASDAVGRLGGDEFAVLLWNLSEPDAQAKARALEALIGGTRVRWEGHDLQVGASAGTAELMPADSPADVLARADRAMYARKAARRAGVMYDPA